MILAPCRFLPTKLQASGVKLKACLARSGRGASCLLKLGLCGLLSAFFLAACAVPRPEPGPSLDAMVGQMIMVGFEGPGVDRPLAEAIHSGKIGGVVLFEVDARCLKRLVGEGAPPEEARAACPKNIRSPEQLRGLTAELKALAPIPLFIAVDQEGGQVARLNPRRGFPPMPSAREVGERDDLAFTRQVYTEMAAQLRAAGVNMNLAPVLDLELDPKSHVVVHDRSFGADPERVLAHARVFLQAHREAGVIPVLKHFPGQGSAAPDPHVGFVDVTRTHRGLELVPFSRLLAEGLADAVMTAHVIHEGYDTTGVPSTLSRPILTGLLRQTLGFQGVIISDDMGMGAIRGNYGFEDAVVRAVNAGVDLLLFAGNTRFDSDRQSPPAAFSVIMRAVQEGEIEKARIVQAFRRIIELKRRYLMRESDTQR